MINVFADFVGKYSEHAFQALDYILDEASKYGVRLLLTLVNNWDNADSKTQVHSSSQLQSGQRVSAAASPTTCFFGLADLFHGSGLPAMLYLADALAI